MQLLRPHYVWPGPSSFVVTVEDTWTPPVYVHKTVTYRMWRFDDVYSNLALVCRVLPQVGTLKRQPVQLLTCDVIMKPNGQWILYLLPHEHNSCFVEVQQCPQKSRRCYNICYRGACLLLLSKFTPLCLSSTSVRVTGNIPLWKFRFCQRCCWRFRCPDVTPRRLSQCLRSDVNYLPALVNNQLDAQLLYFIISLLQFCTCFEQRRAHHQEVKLIQHLV